MRDESLQVRKRDESDMKLYKSDMQNVSFFRLITESLFGILRIPPFVNHKGKDVNSDWLADQWDERSVLGHA